MFYGVMELVPYIGPILGAVPPVLVALFTDPIVALWVALLFVGLQQLEGHVVAPQVFGHTLRINPLLVIFALLLGLQLHGIIGALVALPILAILRETVVYLQPPRDVRALGSHPPRTAVSAVLSGARLAKRYGEREALRDVSFDAAAGELMAIVGPERRRQDDAAVDPRRSPERQLGDGVRPRGRSAIGWRVGWAPQPPAVYSKLSVARTCALFARLEGVADPDARGRADARADRTGRARGRARGATVWRKPPARERRARADRRSAGARAR